MEVLWLRLGEWTSFDEFLALNVHVERLLCQFGMIPWVDQGQVWVEVPLATDAVALGQAAAPARERWARLADGQVDIATLARDEGINDSYVSRVVRLNFLAPELVDAILAGNQNAMLNAAKLKDDAFPIEWEQQLREFAGR